MATVVETIGTASRDFSTMTLWEADLANKNAADDIIGECYDDSAFDENVTISDTTPNSITLSVASGERHDGTAGTGVRVVATTTRQLQPICQGGQDNEIIVEWLEWDQNGNGTYSFNCNSSTAGNVPIIRNNLIHDQNGSNAFRAIIYGPSRDFLACNNICYNSTRNTGNTLPGIYAKADRASGGVFNNTVYNINNPSSTAPVAQIWIGSNDPDGRVKNNLSVGPVTGGTGAADCFKFSGSSSVDSDYNVSDDATADDGGGSNNVINTTLGAVSFVSTVLGSEDLHLSSASSSAHGVGADLGTTPPGVEIDIDGTDRDAGSDTWDAGAHQFVPAGNDPPVSILGQSQIFSTAEEAAIVPAPQATDTENAITQIRFRVDEGVVIATASGAASITTGVDFAGPATVTAITPDLVSHASSSNVWSTSVAYRDGFAFTAHVRAETLPETDENLATVIQKWSQTAGAFAFVSETIVSNATINDPFHANPSIGIDEDGYIHIAYNMHNMPWQYAVSDNPLDIAAFTFRGRVLTGTELTNAAAGTFTFPSYGTADIPGNQITYPIFFNDNNGKLHVAYRHTVRPKLSTFQDRQFSLALAVYDVVGETWSSHASSGEVTIGNADADDLPGGGSSAVVKTLVSDVNERLSSVRAKFDVYNNLHLFYYWRTSKTDSDLEKPSYAMLPNGSTTWQKGDGTALAVPITKANSDVIREVSTPPDNDFGSIAMIDVDVHGNPWIEVDPDLAERWLITWDPVAKDWTTPLALPWSAQAFVIDHFGRQWTMATGPRIHQRYPSDSFVQFYLDAGPDSWTQPRWLFIPELSGALVFTQKSDFTEERLWFVEMPL